MKRKGLDRGHAIIFIVPHYSAHFKVRRLSVEQRLWQWWSLLFYFIHLFSIIYLFIHFIGGWVGIVVSISSCKGSFYYFQPYDTVEMRTKSVI